jgi:protein-disulfide isomerase
MRMKLLILAALALSGPLVHAAERKDQWQEELLLQLSELRKAQGELKQQVVELRAEVAALRAGNRGAPVSLDLRDPQLPSLGAAGAQVAIVEFSDFQCPYCRKHQQAAFPQLREKYLDAGKVKYFFLDYPLDFHAHAREAAIAGACAHQQGSFWPMRDALFESQNKLGRELYLQLAARFGLDSGKFQACLVDAKTGQQIDAHAALGDRAGVQGTPAFLIGRIKDGVLTDTRLLAGARAFQDFARILDQYMTGS